MTGTDEDTKMEAEHLELSSYIRIGDQAVRTGTPHLTLQMTGRPELSLTQFYHIHFTLRRSENDGVDRPCVVFWSPYSGALESSGLVLLRHNEAGGLDPVAVDHTGVSYADGHVKRLVVKGWGNSLRQLEPGAEVSCGAELPERFYKAMRAGETYTLLYPGHEILLWEWGTLKELTGREIEQRAPAATTTEGSPNPVIPGGPAITFKAVEEDEPWPDRAARLAKVGFDSANWEEAQWRSALIWKRQGSPPPIGEEERSPGAPIITATLSYLPHLGGDGTLSVQVAYAYEGVAGKSSVDGQAARPITLHMWTLYAAYTSRREGWRLDRWVTEKTDNGEAGSWQECEQDDDEMGWLFVDEDVDVCVGRDDKNFVSLMPGETWTNSTYFRPLALVPGDTFRCRFKGLVMEWWDWGTMADHVDTVVKLPSWIAGKVTEPTDNGGRPKLVVPGAKEVIFTYTGTGKGVEGK